MKIAILFICTGKYELFWDSFFQSAEKYFLSDAERHYFIFTDSERLLKIKNCFVHPIFQQKLGWPLDTLFRFKMFLQIERELKAFDFIFFFNSNVIFLQKVGNDILPGVKDGGLVAVKHPGFFDKSNDVFTYERNPKSAAYICEGDGKFYFMGGVNGGSGAKFIDLIKTLHNSVEDDLQKDIIAIWHDESHLNKYFLSNKCKVLDPSYGFPENWSLPFEPKILILDKNKFGGHNYLRNDLNRQYVNKAITWIKKWL